MNKSERIKHLKNRLRKGLVICQDSQLEVLEYVENLESVVQAARDMKLNSVYHIGSDLHKALASLTDKEE